ncbi:hypothetical protein ACSYGO_45300 [Streptomyces krungchingensis]
MACQLLRFAPATAAGPPQRLGAFTSAQTGRELAAVEHTDASKQALPDLIPPAVATGTAPGRPPPARSRSHDLPAQA